MTLIHIKMNKNTLPNIVYKSLGEWQLNKNYEH